ncbi:hypothetical protein KKI17_02640 [Patescibacteria group bacterium]|nr:hypothetical protein [Patescibacteria group bacterium]
MSEVLLYFKESAQVAYGGEEQELFPEKDLVRAQFVVELNERLGYPLSSIHIGALVWVEGAGFEQIDVVVGSEMGDIMIAAAVESPKEYESRQEQVMRGLYWKAAVLARAKRVRWLVYYTRWYHIGVLYKRQLVVDYAKYPNYAAWQTASFPSAGVLPVHSPDA